MYSVQISLTIIIVTIVDSQATAVMALIREMQKSDLQAAELPIRNIGSGALSNGGLTTTPPVYT